MEDSKFPTIEGTVVEEWYDDVVMVADKVNISIHAINGISVKSECCVYSSYQFNQGDAIKFRFELVADKTKNTVTGKIRCILPIPRTDYCCVVTNVHRIGDNHIIATDDCPNCNCVIIPKDEKLKVGEDITWQVVLVTDNE